MVWRIVCAGVAALAMAGAAAPGGEVARNGAGWPCWRGPNGNGSADDGGFDLVDDFARAKLLWTSADTIPSNDEKFDRWHAGYSSPVVAGGRVFLFYYRPHGRKDFIFTPEDLAAFGTLGRGRNPPNVWQADDIVHCFDAADGKTLWKHVDGRGLIAAHGKNGGHHTQCADEKRVYGVGTAGGVYCLDAATGEPLWQNYLKESYRDAFERSQAAGAGVFGRNGFNQAPCVIDDVVAVAADRFSAVGFDAATGRKLWTVGIAGGGSGARGESVIPVIWTHKGTRYFIVANTCIVPKTGKVLWRIGGAITTSSPCVTEDYYICSGLGSQAGRAAPAAGSTCFRISPGAFQKLWSLGPDRHPAMGCTDVVCGPYFLQASDDGKEDPTRNTVVVEIATGKVVATIGDTFRTLGYSPTSCRGKVFGGMYGLTMFIVRAEEFRLAYRGGRQQWANSCSPALADGKLCFRSGDRLVCYDLRKR